MQSSVSLVCITYAHDALLYRSPLVPKVRLVREYVLLEYGSLPRIPTDERVIP